MFLIYGGVVLNYYITKPIRKSQIELTEIDELPNNKLSFPFLSSHLNSKEQQSCSKQS